MAQDDEAPPKKKSKLKWIILILLILLLGGGGFAAYSFGVLNDVLGIVDTEDGTADSNAAKGPEGAPPISNVVALPNFTVNLLDPLGRHFLTLDIEVEVLSTAVIKELEAQKPRIRDSIIMLLSSKTYSELSAPEGKLLLKNEILDRINQILGGPKVVQVFFNNIVVRTR